LDPISYGGLSLLDLGYVFSGGMMLHSGDGVSVGLGELDEPLGVRDAIPVNRKTT